MREFSIHKDSTEKVDAQNRSEVGKARTSTIKRLVKTVLYG